MFKIISDGGCDFTGKEAAQHQIDVIPFYVNFDGDFLKVGVDITTERFFERLSAEKGVFPKTSQPNPQDYIDVLQPILEKGEDVLIVTISSKLSGSYNSASIAADILQEEFPQRQVIIFDSLTGSIAQGLILREIIKMRDAGYTLKRTAELARKVQETSRVYITLETLEYAKRGGRIGPTTAFVGGILGLRPILQVENGEVSQLDSVRGKKNVMRLLLAGAVEALADEKENIQLSVGHIFTGKDAGKFKDDLETQLGIQVSTPVTELGATIGAHAGPGALAFAYCKKYQAVEGGNTHA